jgi:phage shock protein PspC (stress-responsive transcriptional regulator)
MTLRWFQIAVILFNLSSIAYGLIVAHRIAGYRYMDPGIRRHYYRRVVLVQAFSCAWLIAYIIFSLVMQRRIDDRHKKTETPQSVSVCADDRCVG